MSKCVVLLEDDPDLADLVTTLLDEAGYHVIHVTTVPDLIAQSVENSPCVALVDGMSPTGFDLWWVGPELARHGVPAVAFTAHASAEGEFQTDRHGFCGIVTKPFDADAFLDLVNGICWDDYQAVAG